MLGSVLGRGSAPVVLGRLMSSPRAPVVLTWEVAVGERALVTAVVCLVAAWVPVLADPQHRPGQRAAELAGRSA